MSRVFGADVLSPRERVGIWHGFLEINTTSFVGLLGFSRWHQFLPLAIWRKGANFLGSQFDDNRESSSAEASEEAKMKTED